MRLFIERLWETIKIVTLYVGGYLLAALISIGLVIFMYDHPKIMFWVVGFPVLLLTVTSLTYGLIQFINWLIIEPIKHSRKVR